MLRNCPRCRGRRELYKAGTGYTYANFGGHLVKCPCCNGSGTITIKSEETEIKTNDKKDTRRKASKTKKAEKSIGSRESA